jgi:hypothetical protein
MKYLLLILFLLIPSTIKADVFITNMNIGSGASLPNTTMTFNGVPMTFNGTVMTFTHS